MKLIPFEHVITFCEKIEYPMSFEENPNISKSFQSL